MFLRRVELRWAQELLVLAVSSKGPCSSLMSFGGAVDRRNLHTLEQQRRLEMFKCEQNRQTAVNEQIIEKVLWTVNSDHSDKQLKTLMNKNISTFRDCLKHISRLQADRAALALFNGTYRSVHEKLKSDGSFIPLEYNCRDEKNIDEVNKAYWRTCSFIVGATIEDSFTNEVQLIGASRSDYKSGRFTYSATIKDLYDWTPTRDELFSLTKKANAKFVRSLLAIKPLIVSAELARDMFEGNNNKIDELDKLLREKKCNNVTVYRMGDFVDFASGPLIPNTSHIGNFAITEVKTVGNTYNFIGVSVPSQLRCSSYSWDLICDASIVDHLTARDQQMLDKH